MRKAVNRLPKRKFGPRQTRQQEAAELSTMRSFRTHRPTPHLIYYSDQIKEKEHAQHYADTVSYLRDWIL
jgi:hypothetical protein